MQRREEDRKKARRDELTGRITGIVVVLALLCLVLSFPIRSYLTINGTYIEVAGEKVSRVEFDYHYNLMKNSYITQNSYYLSMFGIDLSKDPSAQMYNDQLTFQDYFEQMAVNNIAENKALRDQMKAAGFTYDATGEYAKYEEAIRTAASVQGVTEKAYIQQLYGPYATASRVKGFVIENMELGAFYEQVSREKAPTEAEIKAYYEENADSYDSVNYRILTFNAELPTEPTELADPVDETESAEGEEGADGDKAYTGADEEDVQGMYEDYHLACKTVKALTEDAGLEISDSDAKVIDIQQIVLQDEDTARSVLEQVREEGADFSLIAQANSTAGEIDRQLERGTERSRVEEAAFLLSTGEISPVIEENGRYHIIKCVSDYDQEATIKRKEELTRIRKDAALREAYDAFLEEHPLTMSDEIWLGISCKTREDTTTTEFFELYREYFPDQR